MTDWLDCGLEPVPEAVGRRLAGEVQALVADLERAVVAGTRHLTAAEAAFVYRSAMLSAAVRMLARCAPAMADQLLDAMAEIVVKEQALRERARHQTAGGRLS